jgi:hypothetical protein
MIYVIATVVAMLVTQGFIQSSMFNAMFETTSTFLAMLSITALVIIQFLSSFLSWLSFDMEKVPSMEHIPRNYVKVVLIGGGIWSFILSFLVLGIVSLVSGQGLVAVSGSLFIANVFFLSFGGTVGNAAIVFIVTTLNELVRKRSR